MSNAANLDNNNLLMHSPSLPSYDSRYRMAWVVVVKENDSVFQRTVVGDKIEAIHYINAYTTYWLGFPLSAKGFEYLYQEGNDEYTVVRDAGDINLFLSLEETDALVL